MSLWKAPIINSGIVEYTIPYVREEVKQNSQFGMNLFNLFQ